MHNAPDRARYPSLQEDIGEDPARFLDQELVTDSDMRALALARIRGIDTIKTVRAWLAVERNLERGPRQRIEKELVERERTLQEIGERPDRIPDDVRVIPEFVTESAVDIEHADAASARIQQVATDGGSDR